MCENSRTESDGVCAFLGSWPRNMNSFPSTTTVLPAPVSNFPATFGTATPTGDTQRFGPFQKTPFWSPRYLRWSEGPIEIRYALRYRRANWRRIPARPVPGAERQCTETLDPMDGCQRTRNWYPLYRKSLTRWPSQNFTGRTHPSVTNIVTKSDKGGGKGWERIGRHYQRLCRRRKRARRQQKRDR